jgi:hypothetical protein
MNDYLNSVKKQFEYYKMLAEKTFDQLPEEKLFWKFNNESNSIGIIVTHLSGNMLSRWTDFLNSDGEKEWRNRDAEFEDLINSKVELLSKWDNAWKCLFDSLCSLNEDDLYKIVYIRNKPHSVTEAINRQLAHYPYHIGQIVFIGKMAKNNDWDSLSIPKGKSSSYNTRNFAK